MLIKTKLSLMVTLVMLLLLMSYYFIALKYSQEAFLEFASVNAVNINQDTNAQNVGELFNDENITFRSPEQLLSILSLKYPTAFHIIIKGNQLLTHNLPDKVINIDIERQDQTIEITIKETDNKYNLTINENDKIIRFYQQTEVIFLPQSIFIVADSSNIPGFSIEKKLFIALFILAIIAIAITWFITKKLLTPIENLSKGFEQLVLGQSQVSVEIVYQDEIGLLAKRFNETVVELEKLEQTRKDMITDIAHELRTPLSNMQVKIEAIIDGVICIDDDTFSTLLSHINGLAHLVSDLQDLSLAEAGQLNFQLVNISTENIIQTNFELFKTGMDNKNINFQITHLEPAKINVDPNRLNQILFNLIENARKYTPKGGQVDFFGQVKGDSYYFSIADSGVGLPKEAQTKIFNRLYRIQLENHQLISGHGLGLSIAQKLTSLMGGSINVSESIYNGLLITIRFPIININND